MEVGGLEVEQSDRNRKERYQTDKGNRRYPGEPGIIAFGCEPCFQVLSASSLREAHDDPAKVGRFAFAEVSVKYVVSDWTWVSRRIHSSPATLSNISLF